MSAAAARRRKQLAARKAAEASGTITDVVAQQLQKLLQQEALDEATAYEALQLAQSQVKKKVFAGEFASACDLCYSSALALLQRQRVSVASQLLTLLVNVLMETHTDETPEWLNRMVELTSAHDAAMKALTDASAATPLPLQESLRLHRLQREWLKQVCNWSSDLGTTKFGNNTLHQLLATQAWNLAKLEQAYDTDVGGAGAAAVASVVGEEDADVLAELQCDAVQHMALAEDPLQVAKWLATLPDPTAEQTKQGHYCPPCLRDALLTRTVLLLVAMENLRDANTLIREYINTIEKRDIKNLTASYTNKEDGQAPSHVIFCSMLVRMCEKDVRTGPLFSWLLRSFKRELDGLYKPQVILGYTSKIGKLYFGIQPPPSMLNMVENMMNMMGGGGGAMGGGGAAGINPAMMQAALAQMQQMQGM